MKQGSVTVTYKKTTSSLDLQQAGDICTVNVRHPFVANKDSAREGGCGWEDHVSHK